VASTLNVVEIVMRKFLHRTILCTVSVGKFTPIASRDSQGKGKHASRRFIRVGAALSVRSIHAGGLSSSQIA